MRRLWGTPEQASVENVDKTGTPASINVVSNSELHTVVTFGKDGTIITQMNKKSLKPRNQKVSFRQICHQQKVKAPDQIGFKILTMTNLGKAIRKAMLKKIDVLVMMNCCMQYFDSGYQLSGATDYLVAPETIMDFYGYNYKKMLDYLFASGKSVDGLNMAEKTIEFYCQKKYATPALTDSILGSSAIFANDLKHYNNTGDLINKLSKKLLAIPSSDFSSIIDARNKCANIAGVGAYNLLDFFTFIEFLKKDPNFETDEDISNLLQLRTEIVKSEHIGKDTLANSLGTVVKPSGFSIYFPLSENYNSYSSFFKIYVSPTSKFVTPFSKTSSWPKFIIKYVDIAPNLPIF